MGTSPEREPKPISRREALKTIGLGAASVALTACGGGDSNTAAQPAGRMTTPGTAATVLPESVVGGATAAAELGADAGAAGAATVAPTPLPPTPVVAAIGKGNTKVTFWHGLGGADGATMVQMLQEYSGEKNLTVQNETYDWGLFYQKLPTSVVGQKPPDMAIMHEWAIPQFASQGLLQSADDLFFNDGTIPREDFNKDVQAKVTVEGTAQGVLFDNHGWGMYYNTQLIKQAGLDENKLPQNGNEFTEWALKLTTDVNGKHPDENGFNAKKVQVWGTHPGWLRPTLLSTLWQFGGGVFDAESRKATLNSDASVAAVQYWYDLIYEHRVAPAPEAELVPNDLFGANKLALMWNGSWTLNFFKDRPKIEKVTKAAPLPSLSMNGGKAAWMSAHVLVIPQGVPEERLGPAKDLIVWLSNNGAKWATSGQVPARLSVQNSGVIDRMWSVSQFAKEFQTIGRTEPPHTAITEIQAAYEPAFSAALTKTTPVKEALTQANQQIQAILERG